MFDSVAALPVNAIPVRPSHSRWQELENKFIFAASVINIINPQNHLHQILVTMCHSCRICMAKVHDPSGSERTA